MYTKVNFLYRTTRQLFFVCIAMMSYSSVHAFSFDLETLDHKAKNLYVAYQHADCDDEAILWDAFRSTVEMSSVTSAGSASMMMMEMTECQTIASCDRDAEQIAVGSAAPLYTVCEPDPNLGDLDLGMVGDNQIDVALSFTGWNIPTDATVTNATIEFTACANSVGPSSLIIYGEALDNSGPYTAGDDVLSRPRTATSVSWTPGTWTAGTSGVATTTVDISAIIQEIIDRPGYVQGNAIGIQIEGRGLRIAFSYDKDPALAPEMCITYTVPDPPTETCDGCPDISVVSLDGVPNFPTVDLLNVCSTPDTASILIYNQGECMISAVDLMVTFDSGLSYGGFVFMDPNSTGAGTVSATNLSDLTQPTFTVTEIGPGMAFIVNFAMQADCDIDVETEEDVNFDAMVTYTYPDDNGQNATCNVGINEVGAYNSGIRIPVVNVLNVSPDELDITQAGVPQCQTILISQDGIQAFLDEFQFSVTGLDTGAYMVSSISVNGMTVPPTDYSYNASSQTLGMLVTSNYFTANTGANANGDEKFDADERLEIQVCYEVASCIQEANFLMYQAFYGCNNQVCFGISEMQGALDFTPDFGAGVVANSSNVVYGEICGSDMSFDFSLSSANSDPLNGLWEDLIIKYNTCSGGNIELISVVVNGVAAPSSIFDLTNGVVTLDLTNNTSDFDGPGGITDEDNDGIYDDLPGGNSIVVMTVLDIGCAMEGADCGSVGCSISNIEVNGKRNCGQDFQQFAPIGGDGPISFFYGNTGTTTNIDYDLCCGGFVSRVYPVCDVWNPTGIGYELSYEFGSENIGACPSGNGNIEMVITAVANGATRMRNMRYTAGSATYEGAAVTGTTSQYLTVNNASGGLDTVALEIRIPAGSSAIDGVQPHDYFFDLDFKGTCSPNDWVNLSYQVVETCDACGPGGCEIVRACSGARSYVEWAQCTCDCDIFAFIDTLYRTNYGYADKAMTQKLTIDDVPEEDRQRFLPGDTMYYRAGFEINNASVLYDDNFVHRYWQFYVNLREEAGPIMGDVYNSTFGGWFYEDATTGVITEIGIPDCMQNYPDATRDNYWYPTLGLRNMGVENKSENWSDRNNNAYQTCVNDDNVNPDYPPEAAVQYGMYDDDRNDQYTDRQRIFIHWGVTPGCEADDYWTDGLSTDMVDNNCREEFLQQFPIKDGDFIYFDMYVPMVHNPAYDLQMSNGSTLSTSMWLEPWADIVQQTESCGDFVISRTCNTTQTYDGHLPGPMSVTPDVLVTDCDVQVEYDFTLSNPLPEVDLANGEVPWYANEYRPYMATEYLQFHFPSNMVYGDNGVLVMPDGSEQPLPGQYLDASAGNLACITEANGDVCCTALDAESLASMRFNDADYTRGLNILSASTATGPGTSTDLCDSNPLVHVPNDPFPHIPVGGAEPCLTYGVRYNLTSLCPEDVESGDFQLTYQFSEPYIPNLVSRNGGVYRGSHLFSTGSEIGGSYRNLFIDNPYGSNCGNDGADDGCVDFYDLIFPHPEGSTGESNPMRQQGTNTTTPDEFDDQSLDFPPLIPSLENLLEADLAGENETNTFMVCAGTVGGSATHTNVVTSVNIPNSIQFIDAQDISGVPVTWTLAQTLPDSRVYAIEMPDLAPGECAEVVLITELLFCPVGLDIETRICIQTTSGCLEPVKAASLSAAGNSCDMVEACYEYIAEEADLQVEWDPQPQGEYGLCETIPMGVRLKNVKPSILADVKLDFWLPSGLNYVPGSWQACYPGGPTNVGACITIPDPTADPSENNAFGTNFGYDEDALFSTYIDQNGFPGILSSLDSNRLQILFEVETVCDEFVSGTSVYHQANAADPCEARIQSMFVESDPVIIENANPVDFAQFFVFAEPARANCGQDATLRLTYLNISPIGESRESMVCMDIETSTFAYMSGSVQWLAPTTHTPTFTEEMNGAITHICFDIPDGIGPGEAFQVSFDYTVPENIDCGTQNLGVQVSTEIMDQTCSAIGEECSVNVLNSVNPTVELEFLPPLSVASQQLLTKCPNGDGTVDLCYDVELANSGDFYSGDVVIALIRDVNGNQQIDDEIIDTKLADMTHFVSLVDGDTTLVTGCFTVPESQACPVFLMVMQTTDCVCDNLDYYYDSIEPAVNDDMLTEYTLCPGVPFGLENCGSWTYAVNPSNGASITQNANGDSIYVTLNPGFGGTTPVELLVTSQTGGCDEFDFPIDLYSLNDFSFGPYDQVETCEVGCRQLSLNLPPDYESNVTVEWLPDLYLDDNTSLSPTICDPAASINYTVVLTFTNQDGSTCEYQANYPVSVMEQPVVTGVANGNLCSPTQATIMAPAGFSNYSWHQDNGDGTTTVVQTSSSNMYIASEEGSYYVEYSNLGDICPTRSNIFSVSGCIEIEKTIAAIVPTANPNEYTVTYMITVENPGAVGTQYDLYDEPGFDTDIVALAASYTSDQGGGSALALPAPASPGWQLANDVAIAGNTTHTYMISYVVNIDLEDGAVGDDVYTSCGQGSGPENASPGEGLYNNATIDMDEDPSTAEMEDDACGELPYLVMEKEHTSTVSTSLNCYDVTYAVKVTNLGGAPGQYDLVDDPSFDDDFVVNTAFFTTDATGNPGGSLPGNAAFYVLADDQAIATGKIDSFSVTINVCLDLEDPASPGDETYVACGEGSGGGDPAPGEGLFNQATLDTNNDGTPDLTDETTCVDVPYITLEKVQQSATLQANGSYDIVYKITVDNIGGAVGEYDAWDFPQFDDDIVINSASFTSDVPSNGTLPTTVPASPGWVLAADQSIDPGTTHCYTLTVNVSYDFFDTNPMVGDNTYDGCEGTGPDDPGSPGQGLYNEALLDANNDGTIDDVTEEVCEDLESVDVALWKIVNTPGPYAYDDIINFDIRVFNQGTVTLTDVEVIDYPSCGYEYVGGTPTVWTASGPNYTATVPGPIAPGQFVTISINYRVVPCTSGTENAYLNVAEVSAMSDEDGNDVSGDDIDSTPDTTEGNDAGGEVDTASDNVVDGNGTGTPGDEVPATDEDDQDPAQIEIFDLALTKVLDTPAPYGYGDDLTFTIEVTNQGNMVATDIDLIDYIPSGFSYVSGTPAWTASGSNVTTTLPGPIAPGGTATATIVLKVESDNTDGDDSWINVAEITEASDEDGNVTPDVDSTPDATETNDGGGEVFTDSDDVIDGDASGAPGDEDPATDEDDQDPAGIHIVDGALIKVVNTPGPYEYDDVINFDIVVTNQGSVTLTDVEVIDYPSCGYEYVGGTPTIWTASGPNYTATVPGPILPGADVTVSINYKVVPCTSNTENAFLNVAEISGMSDEDGNDISGDDVDSTPDTTEGNDAGGAVDTASDNVIDGDATGTPGDENPVTDEDDQDPAQIEIFDLGLTKVLDTPAPYSYGDDLTFTIEVTNQGNMVATDIDIVDYVPSGYSYVSGTPAWTASGTNVTTTIPGPLLPGNSTTATIVLKLLANNTEDHDSWINVAEITEASDEDGTPTADIDSTPDTTEGNDAGGEVDTASDDVIDGDASGDPGDEDPTTDEDDQDPAGIFIVDVALAKTTVSTGPYTWGDPVTFNIRVVNQGSVTLQNLDVTDYIPCGYTYLPVNDGVWTYDAGTGTAVTEIEGPFDPQDFVDIEIVLELTQCYTNPAEAWTNEAEVSEMFDDEGNNVSNDDIDSTSDTTDGNDAGGLPDGNSDDVVDGDGTGAPNSDDPTTDEDDADPERVEVFDLALTKTVASEGPYNWLDDITFDITVTNQGNEFADNILVTDYMPACFSLNDALWTDNGDGTAELLMSVANGLLAVPLPPGASIVVPITVRVEVCDLQDQVNYAEISSATDEDGNPEDDVDSTADDTNGNDAGGEEDTGSDDVIQGDGTGNPDDEDPTTDEDDHDPEDVIVEVPIWDLSLVKTLSLGQPNPVEVGDVVSFDIQVTNQGTELADNIVVTDYLPTCMTLNDADWTDNNDGTASITLSTANGALVGGPLAPGQSVLVDIQFTVDACATGTIMNWAEISDFTDEYGDQQEDDDSTPNSDPNDDTFVTDDDQMGNGKEGGDEDDHDPADITIIDPINTVFDLALTKTLADGQAGTVGNGATVTFNVNVINQGNIAADNIDVVDYMPDCFVLADPAWTDNNDGTASITLSVANGAMMTPLQPGQTATVPITVILMDCPAGPIENLAEISDATDDDGNPQDDVDSEPDSDPDNDGDPTNDEVDGDPDDPANPDEDDHDPEEIIIDENIPMDFDLALVKMLAPGQTVPVENGDMVNFEIEVFNQGDLSADNIEVTDYLPSCMSLADADWTDNNDGTASIVLSLANGGLVTPLLPGTSVKVQITLSVDNCTDGTVVTNWSEISDATDGAGNPQDDVDSTPDNDPNNDPFMTDDDPDSDGTMDEDDHDPEEVPIGDPADQVFDLALVKVLATGQGANVMTGDYVDYEIYVINQGNVAADNLDVVDYIPSCFTLADPDWTDNNDGTASITYSVANGALATPLLPGESVAIPLTLQVGSCSGTTQRNWAEIEDATDSGGNPQTDVDSTPDSDPNNDAFGDDDETNGDGTDDEDDHDPEDVFVMDELEEIFDLALTKTLPAGMSNTIPTNSTVTFNITVFNQGTVAADNIEVVDYLPACATLEDINWTDNMDGTASIELSVANGYLSYPLPAGEFIVVPITLNYSACPTGAHTNWAEISDATDGDGDPRDDIDSDSDADPDNDPYGNDNQTDGDGTNDEDDHDPEEVIISPVVDPIFDLALTKMLAMGQEANVANGNVVVFEINVHNQGNVPADDIEVIDYLPSCQSLVDPNWFYDSADHAAVRVLSVANGDLTAPLGPGQSTSVTVSVLLTGCPVGPVMNWAEIGDATDGAGNPQDDVDSTMDDDPDNDIYGTDNQTDGDGTDDEDDHDPEQVQVMPDAPSDFDLALIKIVVPGQLEEFSEGDQITFRIQVTNQGDVAADNIEVIDYIPACTSLADADWTDNNDGTASIALSVANGGLPGLLTPGQSVNVDITLTIGDCISGDHLNWAEITGATDGLGNPGNDIDSTPDSDPGNDNYGEDNINDEDGLNGGDEDDHDPEAFNIAQRFDLALIKEVVPGGPYEYGDPVSFNITVMNQGNTHANNIEVTDYVPAGYSFDSGLNTGWTDNGDGTLTYIHTTVLPVDESVQIPLVLTLEPTTGDDADWQNWSEISGATDENGDPVVDIDSQPDEFQGNDNFGEDNQTDGDGTDDEDDHDPADIEVFDLALTKVAVTPGPYRYDDEVTYEIRVYNQGNVPANNVVVNDFLPCGLEYLPVNDGVWTYDASSHTVQTTYVGVIQPGAWAVEYITVKVIPCYEDEPNAWTNYSEIESATDEEGNPREDTDSNDDDNPGNDPYGEDNQLDGDGTDDEDDHDPETIEVFDLAITKESTHFGVDSIGPFIPGDTVQFINTVYNQGNVDAYEIEITDYMRNGYFFDASLNPGWTLTGNLLQRTFPGPLASGDNMVFNVFLVIQVLPGAQPDDWYNELEISDGEDADGNSRVDADSVPDTDPDNDNDLVDGPDDDNIFNGDLNDEEIFNNNGDEDDNDAEEVLVTGEIGDTVFKDLNGDGIQNDGEPGVEGVRVILTRCDGQPVDSWVQDTVYTDENGFYLFDQLLPSIINGDYKLTFDVSHIPSIAVDVPGCDWTFDNVGTDDEVDSDVDLNGCTDCIELLPGERDSTVDAGLLILAKLGDKVWNDCDGDGVQDADEEGIAGIRVELYDHDNDLIKVTTTDANGEYMFTRLYPGQYYVKFIIGEYEFIHSKIGGDGTADSDVTDGNGAGTTDMVYVGPGACNFDDFDAGLYKCVRIGELVWLDYNENDVWDPNENGINGMKVELYKYQDDAWIYYDYTYTGHKPGTPSDDGYFKFCVAPGRYYLRFMNPPEALVPAVENFGINEGIDSDVTGAFGPGTTEEINIRCGEERCDIGAGYYKMGSIGDYVWMDSNSNGMRENGERGLANIVVRAIDLTGTEISNTTTDADGKYMMDYLGKNTYYLKFDLPANLTATTPNMGSDETMDSDVDGSNGPMTTRYYNILPGQHTPHVDAGVVNSVLAIEWNDVWVEETSSAHDVQWSILSESDVSHYEIERSLGDISGFESIGKKLSEGDTQELRNYNFEDYDISYRDIYYYRIKQVDMDGTTTYSKIVSIEKEEVETTVLTKVDIYPNPVVNEVTFDFELGKWTSELSVDIYDVQGQLVKKNVVMDIDVSAGKKVYKLDIDDLAKGVYNVKIKADRQEMNKKLIVIDQ